MTFVTGHTDTNIRNSLILPLIIRQMLQVVPVLRDHVFWSNQEVNRVATSEHIWDTLDGLAVKYRRAKESLKVMITEQISAFKVDCGS